MSANPVPLHGARGAPRSFAVARQPIFDRDLDVIGFELLFRAADGRPPGPEDAERATSSVVLDALGEVGLSTLVGPRTAFVNVSREFLLEMRPLPLPADRVVLELLEGAVVDQALLEVLAELRAQGFRVALDDYAGPVDGDPLVELASIVKIEVGDRDAAELAEVAEALLRRRVQPLAEKVETREQLEVCRAAGFEAFQGFFFARPTIVRGRRVPTRAATALRCAARIQGATSFEELEGVITGDLGLSYKLLRYANSAYFTLPRRVASVREALVLLGSETVRRWAMLMVLSEVGDVPDELLVVGLIRARACEYVAEEVPLGLRHDVAFTVGLFSVVDALLGMPMDEVLAALPFTDDVADALLHHRGPAGALLAALEHWERGDFDAALRMPGGYVLAHAYREGLVWADAESYALRTSG